jgi:hypothetical protein
MPCGACLACSSANLQKQASTRRHQSALCTPAVAARPELDSGLAPLQPPTPRTHAGGALLREKMVEMAADTFVCIVDDSKLVSGLGGSKLAMPVEIVQVSGWG